MCLYGISIYANHYQNRSINECSRNNIDSRHYHKIGIQCIDQNNFPCFLTKDFDLKHFLDQYSQPQEDLNSELGQVLKYFRI